MRQIKLFKRSKFPGLLKADSKSKISSRVIFWCLFCRRSGHTASECVETPNEELSWFFSDARDDLQLPQISNKSESLCHRCARLDILSWLRQEPPIVSDRDLGRKLQHPVLFRSLGTVRSLRLRRDCALCCCLFGLIANPSSLDQEVKLVLSWSMYRLEASIGMNTPEKRATSKYICALLHPSSTDLTVESLASTRGDGLCAIESHGSTIGLSARRVNPNRVNISFVREWISTCERSHPITCTPDVSDDLRKICLIDADRRCLVEHPGDKTDYLALSYVWGNSVQLCPGAGTIGAKLGKLCPTIEDALVLVKDIGKKYLWVDSVCINQSNEEQKAQQIGIMSAIYQGAYATIIAFSGTSADSGLPRVNGRKSPYQQLQCSINGTRLVGLCPTLSQLVWVMPWGNRAWTYQEALLSPRCIYISKYQAQFECNAMTCYESLDESSSCVHQVTHDESWFRRENYLQQINTGVLRSPMAGNKSLESNALALYSISARLYSSRSLTRQSDALNAFSGILQALKKTAYKDGMFWALPHADLNWAMLWEGWKQNPRREGFPSWSWLCWQGGIWPGTPDYEGPYIPHQYAFDLIMWKSGNGDAETIFRTRYKDLAPRACRLFSSDPLSDSLEVNDTECLSLLQKSDLGRRKGLLCVESFTLHFSPANWVTLNNTDEEDYRYFRMEVNGVRLIARVIRSSELVRPSFRRNERTFLLLARNVVEYEDSDIWIDHRFILLSARGEYSERVCVMSLMVPKGHLEVLRSLNLQRTRVVLT